jgi:hypothetical protein
MASTFSTNLAIELIGTGDQAGTWGTTTNSNLGTLIEQAISGYVTQAVATGTDTTITIPNGSTGVARNMYIELTGTGGTNTNLIVPANKKLYFIFNNSTGAVTVKVLGQTGVSVPTGKKMVLVSNGTDIVNGLNYIADFGTNSFSVTNLTASSATITNLIATSGSITNLVSSDASATVLRAGSATLTHLSATSASITNLTLTSLVISNLSIASANITTLTGSTQTLSGNLTLNGGTANGVLYLNGSKVATSGTALVFDGTNLGIGTSSPARRLHVVAADGVTNSLFAGASYALRVQSIAATGTVVDAVNNTEATYQPLLIGGSQTQFMVSGSEKARLVSDNFLLGATASPGVLNTSVVIDSGANSLGGVVMQNNATGRTFSDGGHLYMVGAEMRLYNAESNALLFGTNNTERARITSGGNLLVGTTTDSSGKMTVTAAAAQNAINIIVPTVDYFGATLHNQATSGDNVFIAFGTEASFTTRGSISYNRAAGLIVYATTSDYRAKDILGPVQNSGATIDALKVYEGQMKGATQSRPMLVAHEAQEHAPYAVTGEKDAVNEDGTPKYQHMDVSALVPLLLAEIQSLRARVAQLETK